MDSMVTFDRILELIAVVISYLAIIPLGLFIYYYGSSAIPGRKWRRTYSKSWKTTSIGRTMMYQKIAWFMFLVYSGFNLFVQHYPGRDELRVVIYSALFLLFWRMFYSLRIVQKYGAEKVDAVNAEETRQERAEYRSSHQGEEIPSTGPIEIQKDVTEE